MSFPSFFLAPNNPAQPVSWPLRIMNFLVAILFIALILSFSFSQLRYQWDWRAIYAYRQKFLEGWLTSILVSIASLGLSSAIGLFFAAARRSAFLPLRYFSQIYVEMVRGTPLLVQILIFFYVVAPAFQISDRYRVGVGILILSFFSGAYISEIVRAGIESISQSQLESARAIGLTRAQTYRYVIFPQALRQTLPPLAGQFLSLIKDSSLLSIIGISELTLNAREVNAVTYSAFESYLPLAVGYLILTLPISLWTRYLEQKHKYET